MLPSAGSGIISDDSSSLGREPDVAFLVLIDIYDMMACHEHALEIISGTVIPADAFHRSDPYVAVPVLHYSVRAGSVKRPFIPLFRKIGAETAGIHVQDVHTAGICSYPELISIHTQCMDVVI